MSAEQQELPLADPNVWRPPSGKGKRCGRDPASGPGTCKLWWEGCPKAEERGCYQHWFHKIRPKGSGRF